MTNSNVSAPPRVMMSSTNRAPAIPFPMTTNFCFLLIAFLFLFVVPPLAEWIGSQRLPPEGGTTNASLLNDFADPRRTDLELRHSTDRVERRIGQPIYRLGTAP